MSLCRETPSGVTSGNQPPALEKPAVPLTIEEVYDDVAQNQVAVPELVQSCVHLMRSGKRCPIRPRKGKGPLCARHTAQDPGVEIEHQKVCDLCAVVVNEQSWTKHLTTRRHMNRTEASSRLQNAKLRNDKEAIRRLTMEQAEIQSRIPGDEIDEEYPPPHEYQPPPVRPPAPVAPDPHSRHYLTDEYVDALEWVKQTRRDIQLEQLRLDQEQRAVTERQYASRKRTSQPVPPIDPMERLLKRYRV